jgi:hypothetical protein
MIPLTIFYINTFIDSLDQNQKFEDFDQIRFYSIFWAGDILIKLNDQNYSYPLSFFYKFDKENENHQKEMKQFKKMCKKFDIKHEQAFLSFQEKIREFVRSKFKNLICYETIFK